MNEWRVSVRETAESALSERDKATISIDMTLFERLIGLGEGIDVAGVGVGTSILGEVMVRVHISRR